VYDPQHAGIPGATVTVANLATNVARTVTTTAEGQYVVTPLDPGTYRVSAEIQGFQPAVRDGVELSVGQSVRVELALALSTISTEVQVTAQSPLLNTESATLSQVISNEQIVDLPLNGRSFHELARLTPGTALLAATGNVQTVRPEAVNGNIIGGVSGWQTRFLRNDAFDARNFFAQTKEKLERNQFGSTLGGPVLVPGIYDGRKKTFFFASYEGQRRRQGNVRVSIVPTAAQRTGNFSGLAPIY